MRIKETILIAVCIVIGIAAIALLAAWPFIVMLVALSWNI